MNFQNTIDHIQNELTKPLPGFEAQLRMSPIHRINKLKIPDDAKESAVLILLFPDGKRKTQMVLIQRADYKGTHGGQIALPGGKIEERDQTLLDTALRETEEEIGVPINMVKHIGALTPLFIPVSHFKVHPFIGYVQDPPSYIPDPVEVSGVIDFPLHTLIQDHAVQSGLVPIRGQELKVPYFQIKEHIVWGATAMILSEFVSVLDTFKG